VYRSQVRTLVGTILNLDRVIHPGAVHPHVCGDDSNWHPCPG